jgi:hypothetical protein
MLNVEYLAKQEEIKLAIIIYQPKYHNKEEKP